MPMASVCERLKVHGSQPADVFRGGQDYYDLLLLYLTTIHAFENFEGGQLPGCPLWLRDQKYHTFVIIAFSVRMFSVV